MLPFTAQPTAIIGPGRSFSATASFETGFFRDWILSGEQNQDELRAFLDGVRSRFDMMDASIVSDLSETYYSTDGRTLVLSPDNTERDGWYYLYRDADIETNIDTWYYPESGMVGMWVNASIRDTDGSFLGVTGGGVELSEFSATLHSFGRLPEVNLYLARRDGQIVYAADPQLLRSAANITALWDIPLNDRIVKASIGETWTVIDTERITDPLLFVGYSDTWDTFVVLEKSGHMVRDRIWGTVRSSLLAGGLLTLTFAVLTLLIIHVARKRIHSQSNKLEELAGQDALTGLKNRLRFAEIVTQEIARIRRTGEQSSLILIDLDHFKSVNDTFGHPVGDTMLIATAQVVQSSVRDTDHVARFGGEEFTVLLPGTSPEGAYVVAEKIRRALKECVFEPPAETLTITASFGVAALVGQSAESPHAGGLIDSATCVAYAFREADEALYRAKRKGRDRVELATEQKGRAAHCT